MNQIKSNIQLLPEHIIDQIKAGEVIERPSTLLKELIENSVDAKSTKIEIHLINNGLDLISIIDNGIGINSEELPLAFCRHATSKITRFEDIYKLHSYGFRGEALASIASISKIQCETHSSQGYGLIKIEGGETLSHISETNSSGRMGTKFFIKELFYNTPVRMKFIQSKTSEKNQLKKIINAFLLTHPHIEFVIQWDDKDKEFYSPYPQEKLKLRIQDVIKKGKDSNFVLAENSYDGVNFKCFLSTDSTRGNAHKSYFLFINDRYVNDIQIHKIILNSASGMWPEGETGSYVAFLNIPTDEIDVNIHPNKTVVKLFKAPKSFSVISSSIKNEINNLFAKSQISLPKEQEQSLPLETTTDSFKDLDYKKIDFNEKNDLTDYFANLHIQQENQSDFLKVEDEYKVIFSFNEFLLVQIHESIYSLNRNQLISGSIIDILENKINSESPVPLLVSKPININQKITQENKDSLFYLGFDIDQFDDQTVVLRTFPKELQSYPYIDIAKRLLSIDLSKHKVKDITLNDMKLNELSNNKIIGILKESKIVDLLSKNILKKFSEDVLKKIHNEK